jgi:hypothetical protein
MQAEDLRRWQRQKPFKPFRLHVTDGAAYEVRHPEFLMVLRRYAVVGLALPGAGGEFPETSVDVDLLHITRIEPVEAPASAPPADGAP